MNRVLSTLKAVWHMAKCYILSSFTTAMIIAIAFSSPWPQVLTRMKKQDSEASNWSDTEEMPQGDSGSWRDDLQKAISDIW